MNKRKTVKLFCAFEWTCPECLCKQFVKGFAPEFSPEESAFIGVLVGENAMEDARVRPANVRCLHCKERFRVEL